MSDMFSNSLNIYSNLNMSNSLNIFNQNKNMYSLNLK